jgi:hypothetical protein
MVPIGAMEICAMKNACIDKFNLAVALRSGVGTKLSTNFGKVSTSLK